MDGNRRDERWPVGRTLFVESELEKRVRRALAQPLTHEFKNVSLTEVATFLEEKLNCTVIVDEPALASEGITSDETFTHRARGRSLAIELHALLNSSSDWTSRLTFVLREECLRITTPIAAETQTILRIYQVHDLVVDPNDLTIANPKIEELGWLIQKCCGAGWREQSGGYAELKAFEGPGVLAFGIVQTEEGHEAIEELLAQLRIARVDELRNAQQAGKPEPPRELQVCVPRMPPLPPPPRMPRGKAIEVKRTAAESMIREVLRRPTKLNFVDKPLGEIAAELEKRFGIAVQLDTAALTADGKGSDSTFTFHWLDGELRNALTAMLELQGLTYLVRNDALLITTKTAAETFSRTVVYQIHDLVAQDSGLIGRRTDFEVFQEIITGLIVPETWFDDYHMTGFEAAGIQSLVIVQGDRYHPQIEMFLDLLRDAYEPKVYEAQRRRPVVMPDPLKHPAVRGMGGGF